MRPRPQERRKHRLDANIGLSYNETHEKPFSVTIVEALGWLYLALLVSLVVFHAVSANSSKGALSMLHLEIWPVLIVGGGLVLSLRQGCRALFLCPHTAVMLLVTAGLVAYSRVYWDPKVIVAIAFTDNINLRGLLPEQDDKWRLEFACPGEWGGTCLGFCKKMGVIIRSDGTLRIPSGKMRRLGWIFPNGMPVPDTDTYFLTPTGRVDLTKR